MKRIQCMTVLLGILLLLASAGHSRADVVLEADLQARREWVRRHLVAARPTPERRSEIEVWACLGGLIHNRRAGQPLRIADQSYERGLLAHAPSKLVVRLDAPAKSFSAIVGLDSNEATRPGLGSVEFSVSAGGQIVARSPVLREGMQGVPIVVDLKGATSFILEASDGGDGVSSDHADWANAKVILADGGELWLGDLPVANRGHDIPFSFVYGGTPSQWLLPAWNREDQTKTVGDDRIERVTTWTDPKSGLEVRCESVEFLRFPAVEWTIRFRNPGSSDTPMIQDIRAIDLQLEKSEAGPFTLHTCKGDSCTPDSFAPYELAIHPNASHAFAPPGGRPTEDAFPYFNLEMPGGGAIIALGWPGQWDATFTRDTENAVRVAGGQQRTYFKLTPGEEGRSPLVAFLPWRGGDWIRAQNVWRRWMVAHNLPRPGGQLVSTHYGSCWSATLNPSAEEELGIVDGFRREGINLDYYFIDAGWYPNRGSWVNVGTWEVDESRFPRGIREVSDRVHQYGAKFVLWFEPERVVHGSWLAAEHPDWMLGGGGVRLLNLGHPEAWKWTVDKIDSMITSQGVDVYRQDFNMQPLAYWRSGDTPDRQGLTEMRHVEGYLAFWDELLRRHPDLYIDTCASGGRRNDLETLRRSVPLLRSDCFSPAEAQQAHTMGLALWMPYFGSGMGPGDLYWYRSCIFPASRIGMDTRLQDQDYAMLKRMMDEYRAVEKYLLGDYYPLTSHSLALDVWVGWQFDRPEMGEGMMQLFRRDESPYETARFKLRGLDPEATYSLRDFDQDKPSQATGKELMESGYLAHLPEAHSSAIIQYQKTTP